MHDRPQAVGVGVQFGDEREDAGFAGKVRVYPDGAQITQRLHPGTSAAVGENDAMAVFEQTLRAVQADALAGASDQDRGGGCSHERLASRWVQKL